MTFFPDCTYFDICQDTFEINFVTYLQSQVLIFSNHELGLQQFNELESRTSHRVP